MTFGIQHNWKLVVARFHLMTASPAVSTCTRAARIRVLLNNFQRVRRWISPSDASFISNSVTNLDVALRSDRLACGSKLGKPDSVTSSIGIAEGYSIIAAYRPAAALAWNAGGANVAHKRYVSSLCATPSLILNGSLSPEGIVPARNKRSELRRA